MRINLCCGPNKLLNWVNVDIHGADVNIDLENNLLPFPDSSASVVICISAINYFTRERAKEILSDILRVLKPDGLLRIAVQDLRILAKAYLESDYSFWFQKLDNGKERFAGATFADKFNHFFYGFPSYGKTCKWVYDAESLTNLLAECGFTQIIQKEFMESEIQEIAQIDNRPEQMFFLEARRSAISQEKLIKEAEDLFSQDQNEQAWQRVLGALNFGNRQAIEKAIEISLKLRLPEQSKKVLQSFEHPEKERLSALINRVEMLVSKSRPTPATPDELAALDLYMGAELEDAKHLKACMDWLAQARSSSKDRGVPATYNIRERKFAISYPETTGYIIPTFLSYAKLTGNESWKKAAMDMGDWEIDIQSYQGGAGEPLGVTAPTTPRVFNTGQVILGWISLWRKTRKTRYLEAAVRAGEFILKCMDQDGAWRRYVYQGPKTYKSRVAWALLELSEASGDNRFKHGAELSLNWTLSHAHPDGWFSKASLTKPGRPWTHLIGYVLVGLRECLRFENLSIDYNFAENTLLNAGKNISDIVAEMSENGDLKRLRGLQATYGANWTSDENWNCVTGSAQIAFFLLRQPGLGQSGRAAAEALVGACKTTQFMNTDAPNIYGGLPANIPLNGPYGPYTILNWGVKFFADCLLERSGIVAPTDCLS